MRKTLASAALAALLAAPAAAQSADPVFGYWLVESGKAIVQIVPCGDKACGTIVWLAEPLDAAGQPKVDRRNDDSSLRSRQICGMMMIGGFRNDGPGDWERGWIYNAEDGDTYTAFMNIRRDGRLKVRGYVGVPILGKTQHWTRVQDNRGGC